MGVGKKGPPIAPKLSGLFWATSNSPVREHEPAAPGPRRDPPGGRGILGVGRWALATPTPNNSPRTGTMGSKF